MTVAAAVALAASMRKNVRKAFHEQMFSIQLLQPSQQLAVLISFFSICFVF
jgi:hypothetical protein